MHDERKAVDVNTFPDSIGYSLSSETSGRERSCYKRCWTSVAGKLTDRLLTWSSDQLAGVRIVRRNTWSATGSVFGYVWEVVREEYEKQVGIGAQVTQGNVGDQVMKVEGTRQGK